VADPLPGGPLRRLNPDHLGDHLDRLYRAAWGLCGNRQEAEDLVQDTYAHVLAKPRWLRGDDDLGYLLRALRNTQVSRARTVARRPQTTELGEPAELRTRWDPDASDEVSVLFDAIAALPSDFREALVAIDLVGLTYREAARALRVREATITTRVHRARLRVAAQMTEGEEG
jgi:RNA polymerase sigma-70 factor, ECF subfamily